MRYASFVIFGILGLFLVPLSYAAKPARELPDGGWEKVIRYQRIVGINVIQITPDNQGTWNVKFCGRIVDEEGSEVRPDIPCVDCKVANINEGQIKQACGPIWLQANKL